MTADEVLEEFLLDPCCIDCPASDCINERRMAEEIVRLRAILAELTATAQATGQYDLPTDEPPHDLHDREASA